MTGLLIVTGGSRGIGAAVAQLAASRRWHICLSYLSDEAAAGEVVASCQAYGVTALAVRADVSVEADILHLFAAADAQPIPLRGLVNNAGVVAPQSKVQDLDAARIERMLAVNVLGAFLCGREAVRRMARSRGGTGGAIVNMSSRASVLGSPGEYVDYAASKAAVDALTRGLALEVADDGIRVNAVRPGLIETDIHASGGEPGRVQRLAGSVPMRRGGRADEVAEAVLWLLSEQASFVTGAFLDVSGGR